MAAETIKELQVTVGMLVQQLKLVAVVNKEKGVHKGGTREQQKPKVMVQPKSEAVKEKTQVLQVASVATGATKVIEKPDVKLSKEEAETPSENSGNISVKLQMVAADDVEAEIVRESESAFTKTGVGIGNVAEPVDYEKEFEGVE
ncbi:unnamed protein product [Closterium sp. Naga37s-1]|nr:unnamed protein product [Closterium sp. Naga37s-1]